MRFIMENQVMATLLLFSLTTTPSTVEAHGYAKSPRSRNWIAHEDGHESCHHCLNRGDTAQGDVCGISSDSGTNYMDTGKPFAAEAEYVEGQVIEIESVLTSHHLGHQVIKACPFSDISEVNQTCFDDHVLEFVDDPIYNAPKDVNNPERGYFAPNDGSAEGPGSYSEGQTWGMHFLMNFQLPEGLHGEKVLLQWHYITGNSCRHTGYDTYPWPDGWEPDNMGPCPNPLPTNGANVPPEQFWNCIEVTILPAAPTISPAPTLPPVPTVTPSANPTTEFMCCSQKFKDCDVGWCGTTEAGCDACSGVAWIKPPTEDCTERWQMCSTDSDCCYPASCMGGNCDYDTNNVPPPPTPAPTPPTGNTPTPPTPAPASPTNPGEGCCTRDYKYCHEDAYCNENEEQCTENCHKTWLPNGPLDDCAALWNEECTLDTDCCGPGWAGKAICGDDNRCHPVTGTLTPTRAPTDIPTKTPTPPTPTFTPTAMPTRPPVDLQMFSTDVTMTSFEALEGFAGLHYVVNVDPPVYSVVAEGGAAGSDVVSEGQGYGLLISGITLASMEKDDPNRSAAMDFFYGYFNAWKMMTEVSTGHTDHCQETKFCHGDNNEEIACLPGWKFSKELDDIKGTGSATDGDSDAITGMIFGVKAVADDVEKPVWYEEIRMWADASATQFMYDNTEASSTGQNRIITLGSCWGGWGSAGNNPSYHSPGSYRIMRDYQVNFSGRNYDLPDFNDGLTIEQRWNKLISTSYKFLKGAQCDAIGIVPNWLTVEENSSDGTLNPLMLEFSGSKTPQFEFGSEAGRTMWRVAFDAVSYPCESESARLFLSPAHNRLKNNFDSNWSTGSPWPGSTLESCIPSGILNTTSPMGAWEYIQFMYSPLYSTLAVPIDNSITPSYQQEMVDEAGSHINNGLDSGALSYYHKSWSVIGVLTLNGDVEKASWVLDKASCDSITSSPTKSPVTSSPTNRLGTPVPTNGGVTSAPTKTSLTSLPTKPSSESPLGCYSNNYKDCIPDNLLSGGDSHYKTWLSTGAQSNCIALWGDCTGQAGSCCKPAECFGDRNYAACVPPNGCYSNNYKDCIPDGLASVGDSAYKIWLPEGADTNCISLWDECTGQVGSCCGPAECFGDGEYAACVPYSEGSSA